MGMSGVWGLWVKVSLKRMSAITGKSDGWPLAGLSVQSDEVGSVATHMARLPVALHR